LSDLDPARALDVVLLIGSVLYAWVLLIEIVR